MLLRPSAHRMPTRGRSYSTRPASGCYRSDPSRTCLSSPAGPISLYDAGVKSGRLREDPAQRLTLKHFDELFQNIKRQGSLILTIDTLGLIFLCSYNPPLPPPFTPRSEKLRTKTFRVRDVCYPRCGPASAVRTHHDSVSPPVYELVLPGQREEVQAGARSAAGAARPVPLRRRRLRKDLLDGQAFTPAVFLLLAFFVCSLWLCLFLPLLSPCAACFVPS